MPLDPVEFVEDWRRKLKIPEIPPESEKEWGPFEIVPEDNYWKLPKALNDQMPNPEKHYYKYGTRAEGSCAIHAIFCSLSKTYRNMDWHDRAKIDRRVREVIVDTFRGLSKEEQADLLPGAMDHPLFKKGLPSVRNYSRYVLTEHSWLAQLELVLLSRAFNFGLVVLKCLDRPGNQKEIFTNATLQGPQDARKCVVLFLFGERRKEHFEPLITKEHNGYKFNFTIKQGYAIQDAFYTSKFFDNADLNNSEEQEDDEDEESEEEEDVGAKKKQKQAASRSKAKAPTRKSPRRQSVPKKAKPAPASRSKSKEPLRSSPRRRGVLEEDEGERGAPKKQKPPTRRVTRSSSREKPAAKRIQRDEEEEDAEEREAPKKQKPPTRRVTRSSASRDRDEEDAEERETTKKQKPPTRRVTRSSASRDRRDEEDKDDIRGPKANVQLRKFESISTEFPLCYRELLKLTKNLSHARGIVFVLVPMRVLRIISEARDRSDQEVAKSLLRETVQPGNEYIHYVLGINKLLRDSVIGEQICDVLIDGEREAKPQQIEVKRIFAQDEDTGKYDKSSVVLALQITEKMDKGKTTKNVTCVAAGSYRSVNPADWKNLKFVDNRLDDAGTPTAEDLNKAVLAKTEKLLYVPIICSGKASTALSRASRRTARLLLAFIMSKELSKRTGAGRVYAGVMMDIGAVRRHADGRLEFPAEQIAVDFGFHQKDILDHRQASKLGRKECLEDDNRNNTNCIYHRDFGTRRIYVVYDNTEYIVEHIYNELAQFDNLGVLQDICPLKTGTKVPVCG